MKKNLIATFAAVFTAVLILAGCASSPAAQPSQTSADEMILAAKGEVTAIETLDGNTKITVDGSGIESDATYPLLILNMTDKTPVEANGETKDYTDGSLQVGDIVEVYLSPTTPVTASEPPMATPDRIAVTQPAPEGGAAADVKTEYKGTITEITNDNENALVYVQKEENGEPTDDLRAVVSGDTVITSEKTGDSLSLGDLQAGQKITVTTDGRATFSIPPQAVAKSIVIHDAQEK